MIRRFLVALVVALVALASPAQSGGRGAEWASRAPSSGLNLIPLYTAGWGSTTWAASVGTTTNLNSIQAQGYEWIRIAYNPKDLATATTLQQQDNLISFLRNAIQTWVVRGRKVLLDSHTAYDQTSWTPDDLYADFPNGPKWLTYKRTIQRVAMMLREFPSDRVAFQVFNEIGGNPANWDAAVKDLQRAVRGGGNYNTWALISGDEYSGPSGLDALKSAGFDAQTLYGVTPYTWQQVWIQGLPWPTTGFVYGTGSTSAVNFPPVPSDATAAKAAIDADGSMSAGDKTTYKGFVDSLTGGDGYGFVNSELATVSTFTTAQKIFPYRMISTEDGSHGDWTCGGACIAGATAATRANLALAIQKARIANGVQTNATWHYDQDVFEIVRNGSYTFEPALVVARGWSADGCGNGLIPTNTFETETNTLLTAISADPCAYRQALINATILMLKDAGLWTKLAALYMRGDTDQMVSLNWINPAITLGTSTGSPAYATAAFGNGKVISCTGSNTYTLGINVDTSPIAQNSATYGAKRLTTATNNNGIDLSSASFGVVALDAGGMNPGVLGYRGINGGVGFLGTTTPTNHQAFPQMQGEARTGSADFKNYVDGSYVSTTTATSSAPGSSSLRLCEFGSPRPDGTFSYVFAGSGITDAEMSNLRTILEFYEQAF